MWIASYQPRSNTQQRGHGTAILIPYTSIDVPDGKDPADVRRAIANSVESSRSGRVCRATMTTEGRKLTLCSTYAPPSWRNLYRHFTLIETKGQHLSWEHVFFDTLRDYKSAVLRVKHTITVQLTSVRHGRRPIRPPPRSAIYPALVNEDHNNPNQLSNAFTHALHTAESAVHT